MIVDSDGSKIDWHIGYGPPPDDFLKKLEKSARGIDTYKSLSESYAKNPKDAATVFKLALKLELEEDKAIEKWREGIALDPEGEAGEYVDPYSGRRATYSEYGQFIVARAALQTNGQLMEEFLKKHPRSEWRGQAYSYLARMKSSSPEAEALAFFEEWTREFPDDPNALSSYVRYIDRSGKNLAKGADLVKKIDSLTRYKSFFWSDHQAMAEFFLHQGDGIMAKEVYGPNILVNKSRIFANDLIRYADFWAGRKDNLESSLEAIETALKIRPDEYSVVSSAAAAYIKWDLEDEALAIIGPEYAKKNWNDAQKLWGYASFWSNRGRHLDDALAAAKRTVELEPDGYSGWDVLSQVLFKMKNVKEAIAAGEKAVSLADESIKDFIKKRLDALRIAAEKDKK